MDKGGEDIKNLLIDVGSSFIKFCVFDNVKDTVILEGQEPFPQKQGEGFRIAADEILATVKGIFSRCREFEPRRAFFSVQMHGYITEHDGAFSQYVSWREGGADLDNIANIDLDCEMLGTLFKDNLPLLKMYGDQRYDSFYTLGSYLMYMLTGINATHITDACASGYYYAHNGAVNCYAPAKNMPRAYTEIGPIGNYCGCTLYTPVGDHQISFLGCGNEDGYLLNIGTAAQLSCVDAKGIKGTGREARPYFNSDQRLYTVSGLIGNGDNYVTENVDSFFAILDDAMSRLPKRTHAVIGGGGGELAYDKIRGYFEGKGISCAKGVNIGTEGLKCIARHCVPKVGTMLSELSFPNFPIIAKNSGLDFFIVDNEHGAYDFDSIARIVMTSHLYEMPAIIRIGDSSRASITKLCDMGARGFLLPMTNTAGDIKNVVRYAKYVPVGERGISTTRAHTLYSPPPLEEYIKIANSEMKIYAQIETVCGVESVSKILAVDGVDGVFIGPNDLSADKKCGFDKNKLREYIIIVANAAKAAKKPWGIITASEELTEFALELGVSMISRGSELNMLINGCKKVKERF